MTQTPPTGGITRWPLFVAIALIVAGAGVMYFVTQPAKSTTPVNPDAGELEAMSGAGVLVGDSARFTWSRDPRADVYRLEVYDPGSTLLAAAVLRDTSVIASAVLPDSSHMGVWRVIPVSPGGTELPGTAPAQFVRR